MNLTNVNGQLIVANISKFT